MKRMFVILLGCLLVLSLAACDNGDTNVTDPSEGTAATEATDATDATGESTETETTGESTAADLKALAESCIDKPVDELYSLIGEPERAEYADSCLNPGVGADGNLFYDGFVVYTYREGDEEVVTYVE